MPRHESFPLPSAREREATVQLSDTFSGDLALEGAPPIADFDSLLTAQIRNTGRFVDVQSPIGAWPETGSYGVVLAAELRLEQQRLYSKYVAADRTHLPDAQVLKQSLDRDVVLVVNHAPRTKEHHENGQNGADFYLAELGHSEHRLGLQVFAQAPFFAGVAARGLVQNLWRVRDDDNRVWPEGEQFRSSIVTQSRNFPESLEWQPHPENVIPELGPRGIYLAFADKYGNSRLERPAGLALPEFPGNNFELRVDGKPLPVHGVTRLTEIPEDGLGIYTNPADREHTDRPGYIELVRRVSNPNDPRNSAYETLRRTAAPEGSSQHPDWSQVEIEIAA